MVLGWTAHGLAVLASSAKLPVLTQAGACLVLIASVAGAVLASRIAGRSGSTTAPDRGAERGVGVTGKLSVLLVGLAGFALAAITLLALALPIVAYDALAYRLPVIAQWLDAGHISWVTSDDPVRNGYPLGQEAVSAVLGAAFGSLRASAAVSGMYVLGAALALRCLAGALGVRASFARACGAAFVLVPMVLLNAPTGYVDAAFAGATVTLFCAAALFQLAASPLHGALLGMAAANTLALKGTGLPFAAIVLGVLVADVLLVWRRERILAPWRALGLAVLCALPGAFWAIRNFVHTGNPLWPVAVQLAGHTLLPGVGSMETIIDTVHNTPPELVALPSPLRIASTWLQLHGPALDFDSRLAGLGYAWPLFALPALAVTSLRELRAGWTERRLSALGLVLLLTVACFALQPMKWWARYALFVWGAGALAIAVEAERAARAGKTRAFTAVAGALLLVVGVESSVALSHANGVHLAFSRDGTLRYDPRHAANAHDWVAPELWTLGLEHQRDVCRGSWKPGTDDANLDGVFAQLSPRPRVHVLADDAPGDWPRVLRETRQFGCRTLLLLRASPVLPSARLDAGVSVRPLVAFDPLYRVDTVVDTVVRTSPQQP